MSARECALVALREGFRVLLEEVGKYSVSSLAGFEILKRLVIEYGLLRNRLVSEISELGSVLPYAPSVPYQVTSETARAIVFDIALGCKMAIAAIDRVLSPVTPQALDRLRSLEREVEGLEKKGLEGGVAGDLREAIREAEKGHYLAAALIAGRAIVYMLSKVPGANDEEKAKALAKAAEDREVKRELAQVIRALRLARNFFTHVAGRNPRPEEALELVASAVRIARLWRACGEVGA